METGEKLCEKDLVLGTKLIWKSKGVLYEVTIMEHHSGKLLVNEKAIVDTLVSTIGLTPKQNGRRHFPPLILCLK